MLILAMAGEGGRMPIEVEKKVTTESSGPASEQVSQTATTAKVLTGGETKDARANRGNAWIWYIVGIVDLLLVLGLLFKLFGARTVGFVDFLYGLTNILTAPFRGIFAASQVEGAYFDTASIVAIIIYALLGWLISRLIDLATRPANSPKI